MDVEVDRGESTDDPTPSHSHRKERGGGGEGLAAGCVVLRWSLPYTYYHLSFGKIPSSTAGGLVLEGVSKLPANVMIKNI